VDNEKHYSPQMLQMRGGYQNGNGHFHTIKRYDCLVGDQNDHQLNLRVTDRWYLDSLSTYHFTSKKWWVTVFVTQHRVTVAWQNVKSRLSVTRMESMCSIWTHWLGLRQFTPCGQNVHMVWAV